MKVLVIGASGGTGREIIKQGLQAGHEMTGLVREEPKSDSILPGARLVIGDALDAAVLKQAVAGQDAVADSLGSSMSGPFKEVHLFSESTRVLIDVMQTTGVRRLVCITGIGAGDSHGHGGFLYDQIIQPVLLRGVYADKDRQEQMIQDSGLDWISFVLRCCPTEIP
jgi:putative NADH-flavin reductase